jgi:hypothetical protein
MASLKDTEQITQRLEELVDELRSELGNGNVDFEKLVAVADELSEAADGLAETFNSVNDALSQRLEQVKSGGRSRSSNRQQSGESKSEKTTATRS